MKAFRNLLLGAVALGALACSGHSGWTLSGTAPAGVDTVYIMAPMLTGGWYTLDSAAVNARGEYKFELPRANGELFRLKVGSQSFYLSADSTENLSIDSLGLRAGSVEALLFNAVDSALNAGADGRGVLAALNGQYTSKAAYYATRRMSDLTLLRAVTNRYLDEKPGNPLTVVLASELRGKMPKLQPSGEQTVIVADEIGYYDIELMDRNGKMQRLSQLVDENPLVVLAYADFTTSDVQNVTMALGEAQSRGAAVYEVGFGENQHQWAAASEGIPWISVYQNDAGDKTHISQYAVAQFPTYFIIRNGVVVARTSSAEELKNIL